MSLKLNLSLTWQQHLFKAGRHEQSVQKYNMAAGIAASRFPWETSALVRDELAIVICNRSAAYLAAGDAVAALVDADAVIQLKRPWSKGHFRKAKALLALGKLQDARESAALGLQFEPDSAVASRHFSFSLIFFRKVKQRPLANVALTEFFTGVIVVRPRY
jgi:translocation protein SEC72